MFAALVVVLASLSPSEPNLIVDEGESVDRVTLTLAVRAGSAHDPAGKEGLAALTAHLIASRAAEWGCRVRVGKDVSIFSLTLPPRGARAAVAALVRALSSPGPADRLESDLAPVKVRLAQIEPGADELLAAAFDRLAYRAHPYGRPSRGTRESLAAVAAEDVAAFARERYRKGGVLAGLRAGPESGALVEEVRRALGGLPDGSPPSRPAPASYLSRPRVVVIERTSATESTILIGHPIAPSRAHPDHPALSAAIMELASGEGILARALGTPAGRAGLPAASLDMLDREPPDGPDDPLPQPMREELALVVQVRADPQRAHEAVIVVLQELGRMARQGVDSAALARVSAARAMADSAEGVRDLHWAARLLEPIHRMPALEGRLTRSIGALDQADVQDVLARHLDPRRAAIAALVPDAAGFIRKLTAAAIDLGPEASSGSPGAAGLAGPRLVLTRDDFEPMEEDVAP